MTSRLLAILPGLRRGLLALGLLLAPAVFAADKNATTTFDVPAGDAVVTLKQFAEQSGQAVFYMVDAVRGVKTNAVKGSLAPREALEQLLAGSKLHAVADEKTGALSVTANGKNGPRAAQTESDRPGQKLEVEDGVVKMGEFEVLGSRSMNMDIRRTRNDVQPYVVLDRMQIEKSQATDIKDFLRTRLTMANVPVMNVTTNINLRGLGTNQTLILIDGRRVPGFTLGATPPGRSQADLNGIPLAMVERIEILPSTASGIYGGEATGGVINIVMRKDYSGAVLTTNYLNSFDTDSAQYRADFAWSASLHGGATHVTLTVSYADGNNLVVGDRNLVQRARELAFKNNPAVFTGTSIPPRGYTTNIRSQTGANLVLKSQYGGTALNSPITSVPVGYTGIASDNAAALVANAGRYNLALPDDIFGLRSITASAPREFSLGLSLRQSITPWLEGYLDWTRNESRSVTNASAPATTSTLAATAPNNPFTTAVNVSFPVVGFAGDIYYEPIRSRVTGGVVVKLPGDWTAGLDYTWGRSATTDYNNFPLVGDPDGTGPGISYATALSTGVLDVMRDLNAQPLDLSPYYLPDRFQKNNAGRTTQSATARASGPVVSLPAGAVVVSASAEWNEEQGGDIVYANRNSTTPGFTYQWAPEYRSTNRSAYVETRVPLLAPLADKPKQARLELQLAGRYDAARYRTWETSVLTTIPSPSGPFPAITFLTRNFHATSWTGGLRYQPGAGLTLRASTGTGFLAPSLTALSNSQVTNNVTLTVVDPKRGGIPQTYTGVTRYATGGNPNLRPEDSRSVSAGLIYEPRLWPGLRISVDYTKITKTNEITALTTDQLFAVEDLFPGEIVRAPLTPADQALGYTGGVVTAFSIARAQNIARKVVEAVDFQLDYTRQTPLGEFQVSTVATTNLAFESKILPTTPRIDAVGYANGPMKWRANFGLDWSRGRWFAGWNVIYYAPLRLNNSTDTAATIASTVLTQGSDHFPGQVFHEARVGYQFGPGGEGWRRLFSNLRIRVGVQNIFDRELALRAGTGANFGYQTIEDSRQRRYSLNLQKQF